MSALTIRRLIQIDQHIASGLRDYMCANGFTKVLVGCSGGLDSALTIALAARALGAQHVTAITMPSVYSSPGSVLDSKVLCEGLGVELFTCPITQIVDQLSDTMQQHVGLTPTGVPMENLQARARGLLLMTYSNMRGHLVLSTGNKSEASVGYCTLYGDTCGGLNLIGNLYKTEVFALARHINDADGDELIPTAIIEKAPSAELAPDQKDADSLPPYEILDLILQILDNPTVNRDDGLTWFEQGGLNWYQQMRMDLLSAQMDSDTLNKLINDVLSMVKKSEFKRRQMPPAIALPDNNDFV